MRKLIVLVFIVPTILQAQEARNEIRKGNSEYRDENFSEAELHYRHALEKDPESSRANYNLGNTLYKQQQYQPAITKYETLTNTSSEKEDMARYYYNLGNSYFQSQKLQESIEAYKQSLRLNPQDVDAKHNLFLAQQLMNQQQQNQDQQNQDQHNKDQQNQDQQNQDEQNQDQQQQQRQPQQQSQPQQISQQDAERLLEALEQDEKETMKKVQEQKMNVRKTRVEKEW